MIQMKHMTDKKIKVWILNTFYVFRLHSSAILADLDVKFYPYVKDPIQRLRSSIFHGQLNGMELDDKFLKVFNKTGTFLFPFAHTNVVVRPFIADFIFCRFHVIKTRRIRRKYLFRYICDNNLKKVTRIRKGWFKNRTDRQTLFRFKSFYSFTHLQSTPENASKDLSPQCYAGLVGYIQE